MRSIVEKAPQGFGKDPQSYLYDVVFLKEPLTAGRALKKVPMKEGVDHALAGVRELYLSRLRSKATSSRLNRVASLPIYQNMSIRNWNTTTTLLRKLDEI